MLDSPSALQADSTKSPLTPRDIFRQGSIEIPRDTSRQSSSGSGEITPRGHIVSLGELDETKSEGEGHDLNEAKVTPRAPRLDLLQQNTIDVEFPELVKVEANTFHEQ